MRSPIEMLEALDEFKGEINRRHHELACEVDGVTEEWDGLGRQGAQREDHAAQLLGKLRYHLCDLRLFCATCERQIDEMVANPFGRSDDL